MRIFKNALLEEQFLVGRIWNWWVQSRLSFFLFLFLWFQIWIRRMGILSKAPTPFKGQKFEELRKQHRANGTLFEDPEFPATNASLFYSRQSPGNIEWKRPGVRCYCKPSVLKKKVSNGQLALPAAIISPGRCWAGLPSKMLGNYWKPTSENCIVCVQVTVGLSTCD